MTPVATAVPSAVTLLGQIRTIPDICQHYYFVFPCPEKQLFLLLF